MQLRLSWRGSLKRSVPDKQRQREREAIMQSQTDHSAQKICYARFR
jgi:hypothetical protein